MLKHHNVENYILQVACMHECNLLSSMLGRTAVGLPLVWLMVDILMVVFVLPVLCFRVIEVTKSPSHSHTGPTQHLSLMDMPRNYTEYHVDKMDGFIVSIQQPEATIRSFREKASRLQTIVTFRAQSFQVEGPQKREISLFQGNKIGRFFSAEK